jgi:hypothetical protein
VLKESYLERLDFYEKAFMALFHKGFHDFSENMRVLYEMKGDSQEAIECLEI